MKLTPILLITGASLAISLNSQAQSDPAKDPVVYHPKRVVTLDSASNFRDLGGYPTKDGHHVKWGHIYRSADISKLSNRDLQTLQTLHLTTVCDLRGPQEYQSAPDRLPAGVNRIELPAGSENVNTAQLTAQLQKAANRDSLMAASYTKIDHFKAKYKPMFDQLLMLDTTQALLFHCTAGKDRTGIGAALVLSALGVDQATILKDYAATDVYWQPGREQLIQRMKQAGMNEKAVKAMLAANPTYLAATFKTINDQYGSMDSFLASQMELTPDKLATLRTKYLN